MILLNKLNSIIKTRTDSPHSKVHGPNGKEGEGVNLYHDGHKGNIEQHLDEAWGEREGGRC